MVKEFTNPLLKPSLIAARDNIPAKEIIKKPIQESRGVVGNVKVRGIEKEGEEMDVQCLPITTTSINNMFKASNYLKEHFEHNEDEELPGAQSNEQLVKNEINKEDVAPNEESALVERVKAINSGESNIINESKEKQKKSYSIKEGMSNERNAVLRHSMQPQSTAQTILPGIENLERYSEISNKELQPYPEKYNQPLIHNYFFPKALPVYKRSKKNEIRQFKFLEIDDLNIKSKTGFKGTKFSSNEAQKIKQSLAKLRQTPLIKEEETVIKPKKIALGGTHYKDESFKEILGNINAQVASSSDSLLENNKLINKILKESNNNEEILEEAEDLDASISKAKQQSPQVNL
jgi:hypothetical protein